MIGCGRRDAKFAGGPLAGPPLKPQRCDLVEGVHRGTAVRIVGSRGPVMKAISPFDPETCRKHRWSAGPTPSGRTGYASYSGIRHSLGRSLAASAMDRPADRHRTRHLSVHRQSYPPPPRAEQDQGYRPPAPSLRAQQTRRNAPHRHQEVGTLQGSQASNRRMAHRHAPKLWSRMGIPARLCRRLCPRDFLGCNVRRNRPKRSRFPLGHGRPLSELRDHH